jgi:hypothetical protein
MEHEGAVFFAEDPDEVDGEIGSEDLLGWVGHRGLYA